MERMELLQEDGYVIDPNLSFWYNDVDPLTLFYGSAGTFYIRLIVTDDEEKIGTVLETITILE